MTKTFNVGDVVHIRARRRQGGVVVDPSQSRDWVDCPTHACLVAQTDVCGIQGCYGLNWADDNTPIGLPFYLTNFCNEDGSPLE